MAQRRTKTRAGQHRDTYLALVRRFPLRPIRNEAELDAAFAVLDSLTCRDDLDAGEADYLDVLSDLVERYEDRVHPIPTDDLSEAEMLAHLIEARGVKQVEVARATGIAESTLSEVLRGKRRMTRRQIVKLAGYFAVSPGVFMQSDAQMKEALRE
jgi:HTH-type transcriptional regulator/antitoxin HigA